VLVSATAQCKWPARGLAAGKLLSTRGPGTWVEPRRARGHQNQDAASGPTKIEGRSLLVRGLNALAVANLHGSEYAVDRRHQAARRERERRPRHG